jgi:hypothetical protein
MTDEALRQEVMHRARRRIDDFQVSRSWSTFFAVFQPT